MRRFPLTILFSLAFASLASAATYLGQIGVNIGLGERGGTVVDVAKEIYGWRTTTGADLTTGQVDASGWPKVDAQFVIDWRPVAEWAGSIDDPEAYRADMSGVYHGSFKGQSTLGVSGSATLAHQAYDAATNTTAFDLTVTPPGPQHSFIIISFTGARRAPSDPPGSGLTDFRLIRPGYPAASTQFFTDNFLNTLSSASFSTIRFMDFRAANGSEPDYPATTEWARRKLPGDASQAPIPPLGKRDGASWDAVIELANTVRKDVWINVQLSASPDYVRQLATQLSDTLDPRLNIYVESSNEVWNTGFEQSKYNQAQAAALGIKDIENHARRTVELAKIFRDVFGPDALNHRVRVVLANHAPMLKWWVQPMMEYIQSHDGPPKNFIYAIARQTYFSGGKPTDSVDQLLDAAHADITSQIDDQGVNQAGRKQWIAFAAQWGLAGGCLSYEGGPDHGGGSTDNIANRIMANRAPRMSTEMRYNLDEAFLALGGRLAMQFTLTSAYTRYGCWGLTDDVAKPDRNEKFQAMRQLLGDTAAPPHRPTSLTAQAAGPDVTLKWDAPVTSGTAVTWTVYRITTPWRNYVQLAAGLTTPAFIDKGANSKESVHYAITAVDATGHESAYSEEAHVEPVRTAAAHSPLDLP